MVISLLITDNEVVVRGSVFLYQGMSISTVFVNATVTDGDIKVQVVRRSSACVCRRSGRHPDCLSSTRLYPVNSASVSVTENTGERQVQVVQPPSVVVSGKGSTLV